MMSVSFAFNLAGALSTQLSTFLRHRVGAAMVEARCVWLRTRVKDIMRSLVAVSDSNESASNHPSLYFSTAQLTDREPLVS